MSRKFWIGLAATFLLFVLLGAAVAGGFYIHRQRQIQRWHEAGEKYYNQGKYHLAKSNMGLYLHNHPKDISALRTYVDASLHLVENRRGNLKAAAVGLSQMLKYMPDDDPRRPDVVQELLQTYKKTQSWGNLRYFAKQQLDAHPDNQDFAYYNALALYRQGRFDEAEKALDKLVSEKTHHAAVYYMLASLLSDRRLASQALDVLDKGLKAMPKDPAIRVERAKYFWDRHDYATAMKEVDKALELDPDDYDALVTKAHFDNEHRHFDPAIELAKHALKVDPHQGEAYSILSHAYKRTGRIKEAIKLLSNMDPLLRVDNPATMLALAELQYANKDLDGGDKTVDEYLASYPSHEAIRDYFAGRRALLEGDYEKAIKELSLVYEEQPTFAPAQFFLIVAYLEAGRRQEARSTLEVYLRNYPDDENARALMAREFTRYDDPNSMLDMASGVLANPGSDAPTLVQAALPMFNTALMQGNTDRAADLAKRMLEEAIRRDPKLAEAYTGLADVNTALGDTGKAHQAIQRALKAGVPESELALSEANIDFREQHIDDVEKRMESAFAAPHLKSDQVLRWTKFLTSRNLDALALKGIGIAIKKLPDEDQLPLLIDKARILADKGQIDAAHKLIEQVTPRVAGADDSVVQGLNDAKLQLAQSLLNSKQPGAVARARAIVEPIRSDNPSNVKANLIYANVLANAPQPDYKGAESVLDKILDKDPNNLRALLARATVNVSQGNFDAATKDAQRAVVVAPAFLPAQLRLADILIQHDELSRAQVALQKALAMHSDNFELMVRLATVYLRQRDRASAHRIIGQLDKAADNAEQKQRVAALHSQLLQLGGDYAQAEKVLRQQYKDAPDNLDIAHNLAKSIANQGRRKEAADLLEAFCKRHPDEAAAWIELGQIYEASDDKALISKAMTAFTRALIIEPANTDALREMVQTQTKLGNYTDAMAVADRYLSLKPDDAGMLYQKSLLLTRMASSWPKAEELVTRAISIDDEPQYRSLRGFIYLNTKNYQGAIDDLEAVAKRQTVTNAQLDLALSEAYLGAGKRKQAQHFLNSALKKAKEGEPLDKNRLKRVQEGLKKKEGQA